MDILIKDALAKELVRQNNNIELIASENYVSKDILNLQGSILTNKYAEGYPGRRYYGGCENIDTIEKLAIDYACKLFKCKYANVQPHSGSSANMAVYRALLSPKDKVMGMNLSNGGHLTHGHPLNFSGLDYEIVSYDVDPITQRLNYDEIEIIAILEKPKMIIAGASAYSREIDFKKFREIADKVGAYLMVDMAHIAGLVATSLHNSPVEYAHVVTTTTHKTLRGPRGGLILTNDEEIIKKINRTIFPGIQGGPLEHIIAAKAQCFYEALQPEFIDYQKQVIKNSKVMADTFIKNGVKVITGGTDNHLLLIDVKSSFNITGKDAQNILDRICITTNKNTIPGDIEKPMITSGLRIGSPAMTTRGFKEKEFEKTALIIIEALKNYNDEEKLNKLREDVLEMTKFFPLEY